jgi:hypothetical protein
MRSPPRHMITISPRQAKAVVGFVPRARGGIMSELLLDRAGRRRSPAPMPGFHAGHAPGNKGLRCPADPPKGRGDHCRHARRKRRRARSPPIRWAPAATLRQRGRRNVLRHAQKELVAGGRRGSSSGLRCSSTSRRSTNRQRAPLHARHALARRLRATPALATRSLKTITPTTINYLPTPCRANRGRSRV